MPKINPLCTHLLRRPPTMPSPTDTKENHLHLDSSTLTPAALTSRPITIHSIRSSRPEKGLKAMHLPPIKFIAELSESGEGAEVESSRLTFYPPETRTAVKREYEFEMEKQRSVGLVQVQQRLRGRRGY